jgi:hypothetical protein
MNKAIFWAVAESATYWVLLFLTSAGAEAKEGPPPVLVRSIYASHSGEFRLVVDPVDVQGHGGALCQYERNGKRIWSKPFEFALWQAEIGDSGLICGYAYTLGWRGLGKGGPGEFLVVSISSSGRVAWKDVTTRHESPILDAPPSPVATGLFLDEGSDRLVVRVKNRRVFEEEWWCFRISDGRRTQTIRPIDWMDHRHAALRIVYARPLAGIPLTLVHWNRFETKWGAVFTLVDFKGRPVWSLEFPDYYKVRGDRPFEKEWLDLGFKHGGILRTDQVGRFDVFFSADSQRVTFSVEPNPAGGWTVSELARSPQSFVVPGSAKRRGE